jgi:hypothetical protein
LVQKNESRILRPCGGTEDFVSWACRFDETEETGAPDRRGFLTKAGPHRPDCDAHQKTTCSSLFPTGLRSRFQMEVVSGIASMDWGDQKGNRSPAMRVDT